MRPSERLFQIMETHATSPAIVAGGHEMSYAQLLAEVAHWRERLERDGVGESSVVGVHGEFSRATISLTLALIQARAIVVPFTTSVEDQVARLSAIAGLEAMYRLKPVSEIEFGKSVVGAPNALIAQFRQRRVPGLVVFTSGSTGDPKGILHDLESVIEKFLTPRSPRKTILFLLMDHFGGQNTVLSSLAYGGTAVCLTSRAPREVLEVVAAARANLLPTTPTFLNLVLAAQSYRGLDLSCVRLVTYGTEVMPEATLRKLSTIFPAAQLKQTYGLSETGVLRSTSKSNDSLWMRVGGEGFETKIIDDVLWIRAKSNMVGYLNAPSPFDSEGWLCTGDRVEVDGDFIKVLGRKSEMINVGGQKVFPAEIEDVLLTAANVVDATAYGVKHLLMGSVVHARITLANPEPGDELTRRLRAYCAERLARFKVPIRFEIVEGTGHVSERFKKIRRATASLQDEP